MPTAVHDFFTRFLANGIRDQLKIVANKGGDVGEFASRIENGGSSRIMLPGETGDNSLAMRREPDEQFQHLDAAYPGVVIEVSYSQDGKDLSRLAEDYILRSNGDVKTVLGIDINNAEDSTVSIWHAYYIREVTLGSRARNVTLWWHCSKPEIALSGPRTDPFQATGMS